METWTIKGATLEYDDDTHTYLVDGVIVPSVTQILRAEFKGKYAGVDGEVLQRAANRGTQIHKAIEVFSKTGEDDGSKEVHNFNYLLKRYGYGVAENEVPVIIWKEKPIAAGRLDLVLYADLKGKAFHTKEISAIADIKTTSTLDKDYLGYQLNLYRLGYMQSYEREITNLFGIHLRDDKRKFVEIPVNEAKALEIIEKYERGRE